MKLKVLDLFCGAGGAAMGYDRAFTAAGFAVEIIGIDNRPMPRYPYQFIQADAMTFPLDGFDLIHASPPCQHYVSYTQGQWRRAEHHQDLVDPIRRRLIAAGKPYVLENVPTSPVKPIIILCGSSFGLRVRRHRYFESNCYLWSLPCRHAEQGEPIGVYGNGGPQNPGGRGRRYKNLREAQAAMGIDWMTLPELCQAIPPAYSEWVGRQIAAVLERTAA